MMGQICFHWVCISIKSSHFLFKFLILMANDLVQSILKTEIIATAAASCLADAEDMVTQVSDAPPNGIAL